jgi:FkbM family methyltransferase
MNSILSYSSSVLKPPFILLYRFVFSLLPENLQLKIWEKKLARFLKKDLPSVTHLIKAGGVWVDIGANIGGFTRLMLDRFPDGKAYLFEPVPKYYQYCKKRFSSNPNIIIENLAVSDKNGEAIIYTDKNNIGWNTMIQEKKTENMTPVHINTVMFDDYWKGKSDPVSLIKIDVEGAEFSVLKGMKKTLTEFVLKPHILLEIGWGKDKHPFWNEEAAVFEWLFENGYERFDYNSINSTRDVLISPRKTKHV